MVVKEDQVKKKYPQRQELLPQIKMEEEEVQGKKKLWKQSWILEKENTSTQRRVKGGDQAKVAQKEEMTKTVTTTTWTNQR